mmetsp:Transcript_17179/g.49749  ORF Transcript_17179/g.49749 Transcript_17179/m.49749 type:complete len:217 (+) Transcript_17179:403-1053(+)
MSDNPDSAAAPAPPLASPPGPPPEPDEPPPAHCIASLRIKVCNLRILRGSRRYGVPDPGGVRRGLYTKSRSERRSKSAMSISRLARPIAEDTEACRAPISPGFDDMPSPLDMDRADDALPSESREHPAMDFSLLPLRGDFRPLPGLPGAAAAPKASLAAPGGAIASTLDRHRSNRSKAYSPFPTVEATVCPPLTVRATLARHAASPKVASSVSNTL